MSVDMRSYQSNADRDAGFPGFGAAAGMPVSYAQK